MRARPYLLELLWDGGPKDLISDATRLATFLRELGDRLPDTQRWHVSDGGDFVRLDRHDPVRGIVHMLELNGEEWAYGGRTFTANKVFIRNEHPRSRKIRIELKCGTPPSTVGVWFPNSMSMELSAPREDLESPQSLLHVADTAFRIFKPAWASVGPPDWPVPNLRDQLTGVPKVSWILYLSQTYAVQQELSAQSVIRLGNGHRIVAVEEWFNCDDLEHVARVRALTRELSEAGVLRPRTAPMP